MSILIFRVGKLEQLGATGRVKVVRLLDVPLEAPHLTIFIEV